MLIDFNDFNETVIPNFRGGEKVTTAKMYADNKNKIMYGTLEPSASIGLHIHETSSEIIYILDGGGMVICDGNKESVSKGICHYCPKGHEHSLINNGVSTLIFFAVVAEQ